MECCVCFVPLTVSGGTSDELPDRGAYLRGEGHQRRRGALVSARKRGGVHFTNGYDVLATKSHKGAVSVW